MSKFYRVSFVIELENYCNLEEYFSEMEVPAEYHSDSLEVEEILKFKDEED